MKKKWILIIIIALIWGGLGFYMYDFFTKDEDASGLVSPVIKKPSSILDQIMNKKAGTVFEDDDTINVLLLGIDRRNKSQNGYNTDTMILVSANTETNKIVLTSVPRDLWINGNKINALYSVYGEETLLDAFEKITGQKMDGYIRADFEDIRWITDSFGGIPVDVQRTFTDYTFPNNSDTGIQTVTFTKGVEIMSGERALTFSRSRKGTNGEGSDLMRAGRQHLVLHGMIDAISQPKSIFWPMDIEKFYGTVTAASRMYTTLTLKDVKYLWDFYKDRDLYEIESFVVDGDYVYHPGMYPDSSYHAWVFIAKEPGFTNLHTDLKNKLNKVVGVMEDDTILQYDKDYVKEIITIEEIPQQQ